MKWDLDFVEGEDEFPSFFYDEALERSGKKQRHHSTEVNRLRHAWLEANL